jgi:anthranilate phosphoribosyltransferase
LGPFLNPAGVKRLLIGAANLETAEKLSQVASRLNYEHLLMVVSDEGVDEITLSSETTAFEIKGTEIRKFQIFPKEFGLKGELKDILGGDVSQNAGIIKGILKGEKSLYRDTVLLNSAFALLVSGKIKDAKEGVKIAEDSIDSGNAQKVLESLIEETQRYA